MKDKTKLISRIIMIIMLLVLFVGVTITIVDLLKGKVGKKKKVNDSGQEVVLDNISGKQDQHTVLLYASRSNNGLVNRYEDYYQSVCWTVYYDGTVEYYENYNLSGRTSTVTWELTDDEFDRLIELLQGDFFDYSEDYKSACDGDTWHYTYCNLEGEKLHSYNGYNYSVPVLLEISEILESDMTEQAVLEPVEMGDSHQLLANVVLDRVIQDENADELVSTHWSIFYDGWVEVYETYLIGGTQSIITWKLDDYAYGRLVRELNYHSENPVNEEKLQDKDYLTMAYYDESGVEIYSAKATAARDNVFSSIWNILQIPEEGISYVETSDSNMGYTTTYKVGEYSIAINSIHPGHAESPALFTTYFYWQDAENSSTTIKMSYSFEERSLEESYILENLSKTTINGKEYYYNVLRSDNWVDSLMMYTEVDENSYMMIIMDTTGYHDAEHNWVDETNADIETLIQDKILEIVIDFEVTR